MISVKSAVNDLDRAADELMEKRREMRNCLQFWQGSLGAISEHIFPLFPEAARKVDEDWRQVLACIREGVPSDVLSSTPRLVERVLYNYAQESRRSQRQDLDAVKAILEVMAEAAGSVRTRTDSFGKTFRGVSESLDQMGQLGSLEELRRRLGQEAAQLRDSVTQMVKESEASLVAMEGELRQFREQLAAAESAANTDALTGLGNRRELERQLEVRIEGQRPFCALLVDLDGFKSVNDRFGHDCGDQLLRQFASLLNEQVRPGDVVARWGGDEFFVIFDCPLKDALRRSQQISTRLRRPFEIKWNGRTIIVPMNASSGVVEYSDGESAKSLFRRADQAMYAAKSQRAGTPRPD